MLSQLTGRRSLAGMVEVLRPAVGRLRDGPDNAATLEWREPMAEMTVLEAQTREWQRELLKQGFERGIEQGQRTLLCRLAAQRFGADAGEELGEILARDPSRLEAAADGILDCATETEFFGSLLKWSDLMDELAEMEARAQEWQREWVERGQTEGIQMGQRALLCGLASRRFGAAVGERVAASLADVRDGSRLEAAADLVFDCGTEAELLGKLDAKLA